MCYYISRLFNYRNNTARIFILLHSLSIIYADVPPNPCPEYIQYSSVPPQILLTIPNDYTGSYLLNVSASVPFYTSQSLKLASENYNEVIKAPVRYLKYVLRAPFEELPLITKLVFNSRILCTATPYSVVTSGAVTNFKYYFMIKASAQTTHSVEDFGVNAPPVRTTTSIPPTIATWVPPVVTPRLGDEEQCGKTYQSQSLIIRGRDVAEGDYPWMVALFYYDKNDRKYVYHCVGNLISRQHVITAARCFVFHKVLLFDKEQIVAVLGQINLENFLRGATLAEISAITAHPGYTQDRAGHDLAILTLTNPVQLTRSVRHICLFSGSADAGTVAGWGQTNTAETHTLRLKSLQMPVVTQQECLRSHPAFFNLTSKDTFCAGARDRSGPCIGDSGAGFFVKRDDVYYLKGIVVFSLAVGQTCDLRNYIVLADVSKDERWIRSVIMK